MRRLGLVLGVPGVPALGVGLRVDLVLRVLGAAALGVGLRVDLVLRVLGAATLGVGLRLDVAGVSAFAIDRHLGLILSGPLPGDLP